MKTTKNQLTAAVRRALIRCGLVTAGLVSLAAPAVAGQPCTARHMTVLDMERGMALAERTAERLDESGASVAVIARVGQDLREWNQHYSHIGIVYKTKSAKHKRSVWRVVHKLNNCGTDKAHVFKQGLVEFFSDDPFEWQAAIVPLKPMAATKVRSIINNAHRVTGMHEVRYNMLAYPWSTQYQQSNQWVMETLAMSLGPNIDRRDKAQAWLRLYGYQADVLRIGAMKRLGARMTKANVAFDDHPNSYRYRGKIYTTTADSSLRWLAQSEYGKQRLTVYSSRRADRAAVRSQAEEDWHSN